MSGFVILCLDLGTKTGWAARSESGVIVSGSQHFKPGRFDGGGMRYLRMSSWLDECCLLLRQPSVIAFEEVRRHVGVDAAHAYGGFLATVTSWCEARKIPYEGIPVGTIKKHATGAGNAGKDAVMKAMVKKGHAPKDDNEADALALLHLMMEKHETAILASKRLAPDSKPRNRLQVGALPLARRAVRGR